MFQNITTRVLSSGGGGGEASPPKFSASPPKPFTIINCLILKCVILSKILVECYMKTAKNGQCACMCQHFSPKPKFLDRTLTTHVPLNLLTNLCIKGAHTCTHVHTGLRTHIHTHHKMNVNPPCVHAPRNPLMR